MPAPDTQPKSSSDTPPSFHGRVKAAVTQAATTTVTTAKRAGTATVSAVHSTLRRGLELIAEDPALPTAISREVVKAAPVIGATQRYASAWALYHKALETSDEPKLREARVACLVALMDIGIDVASMGTTRFLRSASFIHRGLKILHSYRVARALTSKEMDLFEFVAHRVVDDPRALRLTNIFLSAVTPSKASPSTNPESSS